MPPTPTPDRWESLESQAARLAAGEVSAVELVEGALARAAATQGTLNAFRSLRPAAARREAEKADVRLAAGERAPLLGVPIAVKDDTDVEGETTAFGCRGKFPPAVADAEIVRRLRVAGAVIIGKTNTPELGQWPFTEGEAFGVTRNPWSGAHSPGGSSGGSAAAVSAGVVAAATGSDGAGSVRIPSAWTGIVGIKPQRGRISSWPDAEAFHGLTTHGVMARTVADAAALLDVVAGSHPGDRHRPPAPSAPFRLAVDRRPGRLRVALSTAVPFSLMPAFLHPEILAAIGAVAERLGGLGHDVEEADPAYGLIGTTFVPRSYTGLREWRKRLPDPRLLDRRTRRNCDAGLVVGPLLRPARAAESWFARRIGAIFERFDVVLAPTTALPPLAAGACDGLSDLATDRVVAGACPYAWPWNVLGWPAINVPAGMTADGLPVGVQLIGPASSEELLIALAAQLEAVARWDLRHPPVDDAA